VTAWLRRYPLTLFAFAMLALYGIAASTGMLSASQQPTARPSTPPVPTSASDPIPRMAIVYDLTGRGSAGFNELAWEGAKRAATALDAEIKEVTSAANDTDADREARLTDLADAHYSPIFVIGSDYASAVAKVAPKYRSTWFAMVDDGSVDAPNVIGIQFHDEQGSFLVGAAAALTSKTAIVGFIGAVRIPSVQSFEAGFTAGARAANPHVTVQVVYLSQPAKVREAALHLYDAGADVIFGTVGDAGNGVIQAAHDRGRWAIGVTNDEYILSDASLRGAVLTSMLKRADVATYMIAEEVANGVPKDGNNMFDVGSGGVGYSTSGGFVDPIKAQLDAFAARIASGEILVPTTP
jgi:basic membrane protein A